MSTPTSLGPSSCVAIAALALSTLAAALQAPAASAAQAGPWSEIARGDLDAIRETLLAHHPGPVDPFNPAYRDWLEDGYLQALAMADSVTDLDGVFAVLSWYTSGFDDGHLGWRAEYTRASSAFPGIVIGRRGGRFIVQSAAPWADDRVDTGMEIVSCGGIPLEDLLVEQVMRFREGIPSLESSRVKLAPELFVLDDNPWRSRWEQCDARDENGPLTIDLAWRNVPNAQLETMIARAAYGSAPESFEVLRPSEDVAWVTVPSLAENQGDNRAGLEALIDSLGGMGEARLVVYDVRGNRGGNSLWGARIAAAYFGEAYVDSVRSVINRGVHVEWRASEGNAAFIERSILPRYEDGSPQRPAFESLVARMRVAVAEGRELVPASVDAGGDRDAERGGGDITPSVSPHPRADRVVLLTDGWCASACLDIADILLAIPGVRHVGAPTSADAVYIDNRSIDLPSGLGRFGFSMKVYRGRLRGHNEPYVPDIAYEGDAWDTETLQAWVVERLR